MLSVQRLGDGQLARDWVDDEDAGRRLVSPRACHAVPQKPVFIPVRADLRNDKRRRKSILKKQLKQGKW